MIGLRKVLKQVGIKNVTTTIFTFEPSYYTKTPFVNINILFLRTQNNHMLNIGKSRRNILDKSDINYNILFSRTFQLSLYQWSKWNMNQMLCCMSGNPEEILLINNKCDTNYDILYFRGLSNCLLIKPHWILCPLR